MDDVLVDFVGGALAVHGWLKQELYAAQPAGHWDMIKPMGLSRDSFWKPIHEGGKMFWIRLRSLPWIHEVTELVESVTNDWHIVSVPSQCPTSYDGKVYWLKRWFGPEFNRFALTPHKHIFAQPGVLLIDDREENVEKFIADGGEGLVFPTRGNTLHRYASDPVDYLAAMLKERERTHALQV